MSEHKYKDDKVYVENSNNEWISIDEILTKKQVVKLINLFGQYIISMTMHNGNIGNTRAEAFIDALDALKKELSK
ncbi:MAG: hypothetical protein R2685_11065 [Candidatus Nitrosocosmicus sp.]|nr:hypothetical protein [Candidatus Nitrosocosmicus sp.]